MGYAAIWVPPTAPREVDPALGEIRGTSEATIEELSRRRTYALVVRITLDDNNPARMGGLAPTGIEFLL